MVQALPTGEIKVCEELGYTRSSSNTGYIYTIDIEYSDELKQKTNKYPFFPEKTSMCRSIYRLSKCKYKERI